MKTTLRNLLAIAVMAFAGLAFAQPAAAQNYGEIFVSSEDSLTLCPDMGLCQMLTTDYELEDRGCRVNDRGRMADTVNFWTFYKTVAGYPSSNTYTAWRINNCSNIRNSVLGGTKVGLVCVDPDGHRYRRICTPAYWWDQ